MRVSDHSAGIGSAAKVGEAKPSARPQAGVPVSSAPAAGDALSVSGSAQFIAVVRDKVSRLPDVRTEKVEALKAKLEADDYNPDPEAVADGLVREHTPARRE